MWSTFRSPTRGAADRARPDEACRRLATTGVRRTAQVWPRRTGPVTLQLAAASGTGQRGTVWAPLLSVDSCYDRQE